MRYGPTARHSAASHASRLLAVVASVAVAAVLTAPASSALVASQQGDTTSTSASALRGQADALANRYFDALTRFETLNAEITRDEQEVRDLSAAARQARADAKARALIAYRSAGSQLSALIDGQSAIDAARRAHLIDNVNARDEQTFSKLRAVTHDLRQQQQALEATRQAQSDMLTTLRAQGDAINSKLSQAIQTQQAAAAATAAAKVAATPATSASHGTAAATTPTTSAAPAATAPAPAPPPNYSGTGGTSPHHDDPFLTCVRTRESSGNYGAVNASGPYLGAYQFLQATWNVAASHAGRSDLVGVPANIATSYDQDEVAWALYQWEGSGPWGGSCG